MFDLKVINSVLDQMEEERGIPRAKMLDAVEQALATAYKKEYGKRGQIVRAHFDIATGTAVFSQIKIVVDESLVRMDEEGEEEAPDLPEHIALEAALPKEGVRVRFDTEKHIMADDARRIKKDIALGEEMVFPLESKDDFGRIAAQTAKQVIIQKIREAEKDAALAEFGQKEGDIIVGIAQRFERGNLYVDLGRVTGAMPYDEQIPGERYRPGERIRALLIKVDETPRGIYLRLSRAHPDFLVKLFAIEAPELAAGTIEIKEVAREAGSRSKVAVFSHDSHIDPVGSLVGQRGVRVSTVMSELGGEKIDIIEWSENPVEFIEDALSPAQVLSVTLKDDPDGDATMRRATVEVAPDQQSLAIGRGGQNVRLAAKLTGWKLDIVSAAGDQLAVADGESVDIPTAAEPVIESAPEEPVGESEDRDTVAPDRQEDQATVTPDEAETAVEEAKNTADAETEKSN